MNTGTTSSLQPGNQRYYFHFGSGRWTGRFRFRITGWRQWRRARLGLKNRFLTVLMHGIGLLFGKTSIRSEFRPYAQRAIATNEIYIYLFGLVIYRQSIEYRLGADGRSVTVVGWERHGPFPWLWKQQIEHWGVVGQDGINAEYTIPMLGDIWTARYQVLADGRQVRSVMTCSWAESGEELLRDSDECTKTS